MSENRAYRKGLPDEIIYGELKRCSGTQFDSQITKIFLSAHAMWNKEKVDSDTFHNIIRKVA